MDRLTKDKIQLIRSYCKGELTIDQKTEFSNFIKELKTCPEHLDEFIDIWLKLYPRTYNQAKYYYRKGFEHFKEKCFDIKK